MRLPSRREFLKSSVRVACTAGLSGRALADSLAVNVPSETLLFPPTLSIKKGVWFEMLPAKLSIADRFKMARDAGFEAIGDAKLRRQHFKPRSEEHTSEL